MNNDNGYVTTTDWMCAFQGVKPSKRLEIEFLDSSSPRAHEVYSDYLVHYIIELRWGFEPKLDFIKSPANICNARGEDMTSTRVVYDVGAMN